MTRDGMHRPSVQAALRVSVASIAWTAGASAASIAVGVHSGTAVLVAFGAIGAVDAVGSVALAHHFRHGLRADALSSSLERIAHRVVLFGLLVVGLGAVVVGGVRLTADHAGEGSIVGVVLAAASLVALVGLSARKQQVARRVGSAALRSDGHLSAIGALQAAVTLAGTAAARALGWTWADAVATAVIGCVAVALAITTWRGD
jgi:divalent metal cation (Fe/Co/Zn/Cd) transporter